ncbi:hypothetical protein F2Q68_00035099 [Brassica cretica]|uniref:Uncharacterized protein n=1 Tax=Brassica cretica TaxID=69181 RepID=A0A8S9GYD8_BRACR|nr:hypothetical protein F2Q68_00035099 [Brassica cretica]
MSHLVKLVVGDWERGGPGLWKFHVDHTRVKYDVILRENKTFSSVMGIVRSKYKLDQLLLPTEPVLLTYDFPEYTTLTGDYTPPPVEIKDDGDVQLFMAIRMDQAGLEMYVTFGDRDVSLYRRQRREEDGIEDDEVVMRAPERMSQPGVRENKKGFVPYEGDGCGEDMYDSDSTDSSSLALVTKEAAEGCGVISLADGPPAMRSGNDQGSEAISPTLKGKEIETSGAAEISLTALWGGIGISEAREEDPPRVILPGGERQGFPSHSVTMGISGVPYNKAAGKHALSTGDAVIHDPYVGHEDINSHTDTSKIPMGIPFEDESDDCRIIGDVLGIPTRILLKCIPYTFSERYMLRPRRKHESSRF